MRYIWSVVFIFLEDSWSFPIDVQWMIARITLEYKVLRAQFLFLYVFALCTWTETNNLSIAWPHNGRVFLKLIQNKLLQYQVMSIPPFWTIDPWINPLTLILICCIIGHIYTNLNMISKIYIPSINTVNTSILTITLIHSWNMTLTEPILISASF